ncbi:DsbA family oxidoreductase [Aerococcaceae bacterium DSM 111021]|nr:DsbA family oxidoreductase [Aerococcaceae bacterium DSM 111021]
MKITIWSDFVCPFCYIAEEHLRQALDIFEGKDDVTVEYNSFQLDPTGKHNPDLNYYETFSQLKGMPNEKVQQMMESVKNMAKEVDLPINYDNAKYANTLNAHRVFQYAKVKGLGNEYFTRFYKAHFVDGLNLEDSETIEMLSVEVGLNLDEVKSILNDNQVNHQEVQRDISTAGSIGVQGVPFFVFNNQYAVSGAQPVEVFKNVLDQVASES